MRYLFLGKGQNTENPSKLIHLGRKVRIIKGVENRVVRIKTQAKITNVKQTAKKADMQQPAKLPLPITIGIGEGWGEEKGLVWFS
ncbi:hypothetical protein [Flavobacterium sp. SM2513]|uniref:hypothetical protein n=1 Tax=Flavobacterium sp. SM2513 TaxID=3424766 RepID=UPI003D7F570C